MSEVEARRGRPRGDALGPSRLRSIFAVSVLGLFLELMLIRWIATEIRIFAYLQNTVLVVCFLGLGLGCFTCRRPVVLRHSLLALTALTALLAIPFTRSWLRQVSELLSVLDDLIIWYQGVGADPLRTIAQLTLGLTITSGVMLLIWFVFVPIGRVLGRLMDDHPHALAAYSANIAGSLAGVWLFVGLSALWTPPVAWFAVVALLVLALLVDQPRGLRRPAELALLGAATLLGWFAGHEAGTLAVYWSPYQKLAVGVPPPQRRAVGEYVITVNNVGYQGMIDQRQTAASMDGRTYPPAMRGLSQYDIPFLLHAAPKKALLVGAGSGNDAAGALRNGVEEVTAVDIDPAIIWIGRRYHPERPYQASGVRVVVDDARSFFATTPERYDVVSFGLLDAHTTTAMTNARLDHYVYTREGLEQAKALLADGGIMVISFDPQRPFIADRIRRTLLEVFGDQPLSFRIPFTGYGWGGDLFVAGDLAGARRRIEDQPRLGALIERWREVERARPAFDTPVATDNWPYLYLKERRIPLLYFLLAGLMLALYGIGSWRLGPRVRPTSWGREHWHFFFLGAAFLLLEVQNISKASVVLGSTWQVNAVVISGVLALALLANATVLAWPRLPLWPVYLLLCGTCIALYFVDLARFAAMPYASKALVVGGLTCLPMLFSGIVFARSFVLTPSRDQALGANLIGALVGALLQSATFVTGIRALLLLVAALYLLAVLTRPRARALGGLPAPPTAPQPL